MLFSIVNSSVSDPLHLMRIRILILGSASGIMDPGPVTDSNRIRLRIRPIIKQIPIYFFLIFFFKRYKTHNDVFFVVVILSLLFTYIKPNK